MSFYAEAIWTCDQCEKKHKETTNNYDLEGDWDGLYMPDGWFRVHKPKLNFCSIECLTDWVRKNEGDEKADKLKTAIWVA